MPRVDELRGFRCNLLSLADERGMAEFSHNVHLRFDSRRRSSDVSLDIRSR